MTIHKIIDDIADNTRKTRMTIDFLTKNIQIVDCNGNTIWAGRPRDLEHEELHAEVIPTLQELE